MINFGLAIERRLVQSPNCHSLLFNLDSLLILLVLKDFFDLTCEDVALAGVTHRPLLLYLENVGSYVFLLPLLRRIVEYELIRQP